MIQIQTFTEDKERTYERHHRTGGIDRSYYSKRQMLHTEIAEHPRTENDERLQNDEFMHPPACFRNIEQRTVEHFGAEMRNKYKRNKDKT